MADSSEFKVSIDPAGAVAGAEVTKRAFEKIEDSARKAGQSASRSMDQAAAAIRRTATAASASRGFGGGGGGGGIGSMLGFGLGGLNTGRIAAAARVGVGRIAGSAAGRGAGSLVGRGLGAIGGPGGMVLGSIVGSALGGMFTGSGGGDDDMMGENTQQLMVRGFQEKRAKAIADLAKRLDEKFQVDMSKTINAVLSASMGDGAGLKGILKNVGIDPDSVGTANDALGALEKAAPAKPKSANELVKERLGNTPFMAGLGGAWDGIISAPGKALNKLGSAYDSLETSALGGLADWLGGGYNEASGDSASLATDVSLAKKEKEARQSPRAGRNAKVIVSAAKNVPTTARSMAGR